MKEKCKEKQRQQRTRETKAKMKNGWELNDFVVHLS